MDLAFAMKLLWLDLETTGLDPRAEQVLEVEVAPADFMNPFELSFSFGTILALEPGRVLSPFITEMHTKNGLLADCALSTQSAEQVDAQLAAMFPPPADRKDLFVLAGSSIHFDHSFIEVHFPRFNKALSYRHYDVSSVSLFCQSLGMPTPKKAEAHRAKDDILESIELAKACKRWLRQDALEERWS